MTTGRKEAMIHKHLVLKATMAGLALLAWGLTLPGSAAASADQTAVVKGNTAFALNLYSRLKTGPGNLIVSPYSVSAALAMTWAGAAGMTATQMMRVLHFDLDQARLHPAFGALQRRLLAGQGWVTQPRWRAGGWRLHLANALWPANDLRLRPGFLAVLRKSYGATPRLQDFRHNAEGARKNINDWVARQTADKIKDLLSPDVVKPTTRLILTNAVYFKATWSAKFNRRLTRPRPWHLAPGRQIKTPTMYKTGRFGYAETPKLQILEMAYTGRAMSLVVILPRRLDGLADLERALTPAALSRWLSGLKRRVVKVFLPKFKTRAKFSLKKTLSAMGMSLAFSNVADFSNMSRPGAGGERLKISEVIHQAFIDVNESGTEAAAATAVVMMRATAAPGPPPPPPPVFRADHPFLFMIRDRRTGTILFLGRVIDPRK
jgi:serpin B